MVPKRFAALDPRSRGDFPATSNASGRWTALQDIEKPGLKRGPAPLNEQLVLANYVARQRDLLRTVGSVVGDIQRRGTLA
jgi:hypothetical protein